MPNRPYLVCIISVVLISLGAKAETPKITSSAPVQITNSTLYCKFSGTKGSMYFENSGDRPYFGCNAHCEWISNASRFTGDFDNFDIGKGEKQTKWSKDYGQAIIKAENARLICK